MALRSCSCFAQLQVAHGVGGVEKRVIQATYSSVCDGSIGPYMA